MLSPVNLDDTALPAWQLFVRYAGDECASAFDGSVRVALDQPDRVDEVGEDPASLKARHRTRGAAER
jgi:hypothetical protein